MDAQRFDSITRQVSRRGVVALGMGLLTGNASSAQAGVGRCGGAPNIFTRRGRNGAGSCETDADCAAGCACLERRQGCCYTARKKKRGKRRGPRRCIDGAPDLYCTPVGAP